MRTKCFGFVGNPSRRCGGAVLLVTLIMLLLMTLMAVTSFNLGTGDLQMAGNVANRQQTFFATQAAIEEVISSTQFMDSPNAVFASGCGDSNTRCFDVNANGNDDIAVTVDPPGCVLAAPIGMSDLNLETEDSGDWGCTASVGQNFGVSGAGGGESLCSDAVWDIRATGVDALSGARMVIRQGVGFRTASTNVANVCPD